MNLLKRYNFYGLIVPLVFLCIWEAAARYDILPPSLSAAPTKIFCVFWQNIADGTLPRHGFFSLRRLVTAVAIGTVLGITSGMFVGQSKLADRLISPLLQLLSPIPVVVWMPFIIALFGSGEPYKISLGAIATYLIVHMHTFLAVRGTQREYMELAETYEKTNFQKTWHIFLPAASPSIFAAIRLSLAIGWIVIFFAEYGSAMQGSEGLGWFIADAREVGQVENQYAGVLFLAIIGYFTDDLIYRIQRRKLAWIDSQEMAEMRKAM